MSLPPVVRALQVNRPRAEVFDRFTAGIGAWWPLGSHGLFQGEAADVVLRDGQLLERAVDGREAVWGDVVAWEPPSRLVLRWHPGIEPTGAGAVEVTFRELTSVPTGPATLVELTHSGWHARGDAAADVRRSYNGPAGWGAVLDHFADLADQAADPASRPGFDPVALTAAYDAFYAEAEAGGFGEPGPGEWSAERVVAHIAVNDGLLAAVTRALIEREPGRLENLVSTDAGVLDAWIRRHGDLAALAAAGRERGRMLVALLGRLDDDRAATAVPTRLLDSGEVALDMAVPWSRLTGIQGAGHLPGHTAQLRALRPGS